MSIEGDLKIRLGFLADISCISNIAVNKFDCGEKALNKFAAKQLIKRDEDGKHRAIIALRGSDLAAYITLAPHQLDNEEKLMAGDYKTVPVLMVEQVATDLRYQRMGIAKQLMAKAFSTAAKASGQMGITGVALWAHPASVSFYDSLGFVKLQGREEGSIVLTLMFISISTIKDSLHSSVTPSTV